jgi:hypothetical protein
MYHTSEAEYYPGNEQGCLRGTRRGVLLQLEDWLGDKQGPHLFWLTGLMGSGKTAIARTFAEITFAEGTLGASFFCSQDFDDRSNFQVIFPTLAFQLAHRYPRFREELLKLLRTNPAIGQEFDLDLQMEKLIVGPLKATQIHILIIIDAVDECKDQKVEAAFMLTLSKYVDQIPNVKFFIAGRAVGAFCFGFLLPPLSHVTKVLRLYEVERCLVEEDIDRYLRFRLIELAKAESRCSFPDDWPNQYIINNLAWKAAGIFLNASTFIEFIASKYHFPIDKLALITSLPRSITRDRKSRTDLLRVLEQALRDADPHVQSVYRNLLWKR